MIPEAHINEFVSKLRSAAEDNLQSVVLYGSAASGDFHPDFSNVNLLCVLRETGYPALAAIAPVVKWWTGKKHNPPLVLGGEELKRSADVFSIEIWDMKQRHRLLFGEDLLAALDVPMDLHRAQLEYELREKTILLRQQIMLHAGSDRRLWDLMLQSVSSFITLFRHVLLESGAPEPTKRDVIQTLSSKIAFDAAAFLHLLDIREGKAKQHTNDAAAVAAKYLAGVQQVTDAVDAMGTSNI